MSRVRLSRSEAENGNLPAICMRCGMPAVEWRVKELAWKPDWINLFLVFAPPLYFIVAASERRYCILQAPFCTKCANRRSFHPTEITEHNITFKGVSDKFARAYMLDRPF
jgi:hypothetical protein